MTLHAFKNMQQTDTPRHPTLGGLILRPQGSSLSLHVRTHCAHIHTHTHAHARAHCTHKLAPNEGRKRHKASNLGGLRLRALGGGLRRGGLLDTLCVCVCVCVCVTVCVCDCV